MMGFKWGRRINRRDEVNTNDKNVIFSIWQVDVQHLSLRANRSSDSSHALWSPVHTPGWGNWQAQGKKEGKTKGCCAVSLLSHSCELDSTYILTHIDFLKIIKPLNPCRHNNWKVNLPDQIDSLLFFLQCYFLTFASQKGRQSLLRLSLDMWTKHNRKFVVFFHMTIVTI
jgi:hypothetical protein